MKPLLSGYTLAATLALFSPQVASAASIHVNMYASNGGNQNPQNAAALVGPAGGAGETWNQYNTTSGSGLLDSTGAATTVGFTNNISSGWAWGNPSLEAVKAGRAQFGKGNDSTHTITGLNPGGMYNIWIASYAHNASDTEAAHGLWSTTNTTSTIGAQAINGFTLNGSTWEYGRNYVSFENVVADGSGQIAFLGDASDDGETGGVGATRLALSAFQIQDVIVAIPEPSSTALLGLGGLALLLRRRRA